MKQIKFIIGIILSPTIIPVTKTLFFVLTNQSKYNFNYDTLFIVAISFILGLLALNILPKPKKLYIISHELSHAFFGILFGSKIKSIRIFKNSGFVKLSKTNFIITLAPYFFPFFSIIIIIVYYLLSLFFPVTNYYNIFIILVSLTYSFHIFFTIHIMRTKQSDISQNGNLFSYVVIYNLNLIILIFWLICVLPINFESALFYLKDEIIDIYANIITLFIDLIYKYKVY